MTARRAPGRRRRRLAGEGVLVDGPARHLGAVHHPAGHADHLGGERLDVLGRDPGRAEPGGDVGRTQVLRLHQAQGRDVAGVARIQRRGRLGPGQLGPHRAGQRRVGGDPGLVLLRRQLRVEEHRLAQLRQHVVRASGRAARRCGPGRPRRSRAAPPPARRRRGDQRLDRGMDHPLVEHRTRPGRCRSPRRTPRSTTPATRRGRP